ncbi:MAG: hypothetical protein ACR2OM_03835, partial [Aestuariivirgaceae bacterium]
MKPEIITNPQQINQPSGSPEYSSGPRTATHVLNSGEIHMTTSNNPETVVLHTGYRADPATGAVAVPIYQTTAYQFENTDNACK